MGGKCILGTISTSTGYSRIFLHSALNSSEFSLTPPGTQSNFIFQLQDGDFKTLKERNQIARVTQLQSEGKLQDTDIETEVIQLAEAASGTGNDPPTLPKYPDPS